MDDRAKWRSERITFYEAAFTSISEMVLLYLKTVHLYIYNIQTYKTDSFNCSDKEIGSDRCISYDFESDKNGASY